MDELGSNSKTTLAHHVDRAFNLTEEIRALKVDRKEFMKSGKEKGYPMGELVALNKQDDDKAKEKAERLLEAGILLGRPVFTEEVDTSNLKSELSDADQSAAKNLVDEVVKIDTEVAALNKDLKEVYKEAKGDGFVVPVIKQIVALKVDPDKAADYKEFQLVYSKYQKALENS